jgi:hypothetical protein
MDPYAKPNERKVGANRPRVVHLPPPVTQRTKKEREIEKRALADERRAIKKSARQALRRQMLEELKDL